MALMDFTIPGSTDPTSTPDELKRRAALAEGLIKQGTDTSPVYGWSGILARALQGGVGGYQQAQIRREGAEAQRQAQLQFADLVGGGAAPVTPAAASSSMGALPAAARAAAPDTTGKIYNNDEPSPLDPPSGDDRRKMMATILGEAGNEPQLGKNAVASVIRTRAVDGGYGGDTPSGVVTAPNQFEPWNTEEGRARMARALADPKQAAAADAAIASAYGEGGKAPEDPTEGMTHFYSPGTQAALGRKPPGWAGGESVTIGGHVFNSPDEAPGKPVQVASASAFAPQDAVAAVNGAAAGRPAANEPAASVQPAGRRYDPQKLLAIMNNPYSTPAAQQVATMIYKQQLEPKETFRQETDAAGNIWSVNNQSGQRTVALKKDGAFGQPYRDDDGNMVQRGSDGKISVVSAADKAPTSVSEYKFYTTNFKPTAERPEPMNYDTWATAKARAAATTINNSNNTGGGSDKQIFDAFDERAKEARATAVGLTGLRNAREALEGAGGVITGGGANARLYLQKIGALVGVTDPAAIQNTETFRAAIAPQVASVLKSTVGTANISNSDRTFAEKAAGGSIDLDAGSIKRLLDIMERASVARLQDHQEQLDAVYPDPVANKRERSLFGIKVPTRAAPPAGATKSGIKWSVE